MQEDSTDKIKDEPCYFYVDSEILTSYREPIKKITSKNVEEKIEGLKSILSSLSRSTYCPPDILMQAIHSLTIVDDIRIKKLLFLFWEVVNKRDEKGKIRDEIILVCNGIRKDLNSPNEYVRGRTLRLLTKLPIPEIFENLRSSIVDNLTHVHAYVRSNALVCLKRFSEKFGVDSLPDSLPDTLRDMIIKDPDASTRRDAFVLFSSIAPIESLALAKEIVESNEVESLGELFVLSIIDTLRKLSVIFPQKISGFVKILIELSVHKSHSVLLEISSLMLEISSNPSVVAKSVNILCALLAEIKENNTLITILNKLYSIKKYNPEILQEQILTFANLINMNYTNELRNLAFQLINDLIIKSSAPHIFDKFIIVYNHLNSINENENTISLKNQILECMIQNICKFPDIDSTYTFFLLDKNLTYNGDKKYIENQIISIKQLFKIYSSNKDVLEKMIDKCLNLFEDITQYEIMQLLLYLLSSLSVSEAHLENIYKLITKCIGSFPLVPEDYGTEEKDKTKTRKITRTVVLPDGSYGTETKIVEEKDINKDQKIKNLRKFILESNYYFSANLVSSLTNIIFKMKNLENFEKFNLYYYNVLNIICAILKLDSKVIYKDPDNTKRIEICLKFLLTDNNSIFDLWNEYLKKCENEDKLKDVPIISENIIKKTQTKRKVEVDDAINFRHCKIYDPENFEVEEENNNNNNYVNVENNESSFKSPSTSFTSIISGSEDPIFVEAHVNIYSFDISIEFNIENTSKTTFQNAKINVFVPKGLFLIENGENFTLFPGKKTVVRTCIKYQQSQTAYIFANIEYNNAKGENLFVNLSGLFLDLLFPSLSPISPVEFRKKWAEYAWEHNVMLVSRRGGFRATISDVAEKLGLFLVFPKNIEEIDEDEGFAVVNLYAKTRMEEDGLINISVEKTKDNKIIGTCVIRSKTKDFMTSLGEKIKALFS